MSQVTETNTVTLSAAPAKERSLNNTTCRLSYDCLISATKGFVHNFSNLTAEEKLEYKSLTNYVKQLEKCVAVYKSGAQSLPRVKKVVTKKEEQSPTAAAAAQAVAVAAVTPAATETSSSSSAPSGKKSKKGSSSTATASTTPAVEVAATPAAPVETAPAQESKGKSKKAAPVKTK